MRKALFPGTFDPPSLGHLDIIKRAINVCDKLYIGVALNSTKQKLLFPEQERLPLLKKMTAGIKNIEIVSFSSLVVEFMKENNLDFIVRGLRVFSDFEYEFKMALANRKMSGIETVFFMTNESLAHISSSLIRDIGSRGHRLHDFVPRSIEEDVFKQFQK